MFRHSLIIIGGCCAIPLRYVFKLIGFSPKGRHKCVNFSSFGKF